MSADSEQVKERLAKWMMGAMALLVVAVVAHGAWRMAERAAYDKGWRHAELFHEVPFSGSR